MKSYLINCLLAFWLIGLLLVAATLIVCIPQLRENFNKIFNATAMTWDEAKYILITDYILSIPLSLFVGGVFQLIEKNGGDIYE